jgi:hypothetical protein
MVKGLGQEKKGWAMSFVRVSGDWRAYYDRQGKPMDHDDWADKLRHAEYRRVASTVLANGMLVSTTWFGLDCGDNSGAPLIFETNVYDSEDEERRSCVQCKQYSTEQEALAGHKRSVDWWSERRE